MDRQLGMCVLGAALALSAVAHGQIVPTTLRDGLKTVPYKRMATAPPASVVEHGLQTVPAPSKNDYSDGKTWLCKPGQQDACAVDQTTTIVAADGKLTREEWKANPSALSTASTSIRTARSTRAGDCTSST